MDSNLSALVLLVNITTVSSIPTTIFETSVKDMSKQYKFNAPNEKVKCIAIHKVPKTSQCEFVMRTPNCDGAAQFFEYHRILYCSIPEITTIRERFYTAIFILCIWLVILFTILGITADDFFTPALGVISKMLGISENLAGVTILAFGNGSPDLFTSLSNATGDTELMYCELLGGGIFVTAIIAGMICIVRPFRLQKLPFLRDSLFYLASVIWIIHCVGDGFLNVYEVVSFIVIYVVYLIIVVIGHFRTRQKHHILAPRNARSENLSYVYPGTNVQVPPRVGFRRRSKSFTASIDVALQTERLAALSSVGEDELLKRERNAHSGIIEEVYHPETICKELRTEFIPFERKDWKEFSRFQKMVEILKIVPEFILKWIIPVVNLTSFNNGWCKPLAMIHCVIFPCVFAILTGCINFTIAGYLGWPALLLGGSILALLVAFSSVRCRPPIYHNAFAVMGFLNAVLVIYVVANELVSLLHCLGTVLNVHESFLGTTVLAWGNSIGDFVANVSIARHGFQRMGFAACFGGPMFNTLLGLGCTFAIRMLTNGKDELPIHTGLLGPSCSIFLGFSLFFSIVAMSLTRFNARRSYGCFLVVTYGLFLLFCCFGELRLIQPLQIDHLFMKDNTGLFDN